MASFPSPQREPFLDNHLQAVINQRGKELLGMALIGLGLMLALILASYSPQDPSWMAATDEPVQNALGRIGAWIAAPLMLSVGKGSWGLAIALCVWGLRLIVHRGEDRILGRMPFLVPATFLASVWLATLVPAASWGNEFGVGGNFGDAILGAVLTALPLTSSFGFNLLTVLLFAATVALWLYVLGTTLHELFAFSAFLMSGFILSYAALMTALGGSARGMTGLASHGAARLHARRQAREQARAVAQQAMAQRETYVAQGAPWAEAPTTGWGHSPYAHPQAYPDPAAVERHRDQRPVRIYRNAESGDLADETLLGAMAPAAQPGYRPHHVEPPLTAPQQPRPVAHQARTPGTSAMADWQQPERPGLLQRVSNLGRRKPEPESAADRGDFGWPLPQGELIEPEMPEDAWDVERPTPERISTRISDLIRTRKTEKPVLRFDPQTHAPAPAPRVPVEPPLTAARPAATASHPHGRHATPETSATSTANPASLAFGFAATQTVYPGQISFDAAPAAPVAPQPVRAERSGTLPRFAERAPAPVYDDYVDEDAVFDDDDNFRIDPTPMDRAPTPSVLNRRVVQTPARRTVAPSRQAQAERQPTLPFEPRRAASFELPPLSLLQDPSSIERYSLSNEALEENARMLESVLEDYGVRGEIVSVRPGPVVTMYELEPAPGLKASRVIGLSDDIARSMSALSARVSTVPGRSVIGIELPNQRREKVVLREILGTRDFGDSNQRLPLALGKDIGGEAVVANLAKMPHLLIAGTTGSGKSVAINTMILSLLYKLTPAECRLIMIDPKMLELSVYDGIPHLLSPVVTDPKKAVVALKWVVGEMEERYRKMSKMGVRNIEGYNGRVREALSKGEMFKRTVQTGFDDATGDPVFETEEFAPELLPFIVVIVDEMADLMMVAGKEIEACIQRLAQMARASGIHLIMATQRPSVDVITGTIKANFPTRISFQVTSKIDSRTILGEQGAEQLLGMGDMLYMAGGSKITRVHGPFVSDEEVEEVVTHLKSFGPADYVNGVLDGPDPERESDIDTVLGLGDGTGGDDALYDQAVAIVARDRKCSTSYIQRKLGIGYNKAARLVEQMEEQGVVSTANHVGKREILVPESH
ncbi:MAG: DNA translocase FtsK 4TM domain-containing protein [Paracoccaceae bacterium]